MLNEIAGFLATPAIVEWLIARAILTPYAHIGSQDGRTVYMFRYWLFNPYPGRDQAKRKPWSPWYWLPSVRLHRIMRPDLDRHLHDHPWNARTFILRGWYVETREVESSFLDSDGTRTPYTYWERFWRMPGETAALKYGEFHRIDEVSPNGVWTLFVTWRYRGVWGFKLEDGSKIPHHEYENS